MAGRRRGDNEPSQSDKMTVSKAQLARIFGKSLTTMDAWIGKGMPYVAKGSVSQDWLFCPADVIEWRTRRSVDDSVKKHVVAKDHVSIEEANRRRAVANAVSAEIAADEAMSRVVDVSDATEATGAFCMVLKTGLGNAAAKIAGRATTMSRAPEIQAMVETELNRAFAAAHAELEVRWSKVIRPSDEGQQDAASA